MGGGQNARATGGPGILPVTLMRYWMRHERVSGKPLAYRSVPQDFQRYFLAGREGEQVAVRAVGRSGLRRATGDGDF